MNFNQDQHRFANLASLINLSRPPNHHSCRTHDWGRAFSRRQFMGTAAGAAGFMLGSGFLSSGFAADCDDPRPIPGGNQFLFPDPRLFHVLLPGFPSFPNNNPATNDPSLITNFNGHVGLAYVDGTGTHTNLTTGAVSHLPFEVDLRFMKGTYVGLDGRHHHGAFALI